MNRTALLSVAVAMVAGSVVSMCLASPQAGNDAGAPYVTKMPMGFRDWKVISVANEEGNLHSFSIVLGNDVAFKAARAGTLPYPDGSIIAALHFQHVASEENDQIFGQPQSFVPGQPTNTQFMVKDSTKYAATGGWGFGHFQDGKAADAAFMKPCFPCHDRIKDKDLVFTHYAP